MRVLALDAATEACSVALMIDGEIISRSLESGRSNAAKLVRMAEQLMAEAQLSLGMLDGIASSIGPGAFTGVRITVAVAQGLAFGAHLRVAPVSTLEALALQVPFSEGERVLACLDARMGEVYWGCFAAQRVAGPIGAGAPRVSSPQGVAIEADRLYAGVGRGFSAYPNLARIPGLTITPERARALPNAREIARLGALRLAAGEGIDPADLKPLYLRDKVALTEAERAAEQR